MTHQFMNTVGTVLHSGDVFLQRGPERREGGRVQAQKKKLKQDT